MATQSLQEKIDELRARINLLGESKISSCYSFGNSDCCYLTQYVINTCIYVLNCAIACFNDCQIATEANTTERTEAFNTKPTHMMT